MADGGREDIHRTTERESGVQVAWDGNRGWVHVESHDDSAWEGRNTAAPLGPPEKSGAGMYKMHFPAKDGIRRCPVEGCPGVLATRAAMWVHFVHRHVHDTVVIL